MPPKNRDLIKMLEGDGWYFKRQRGSHAQYGNPTKPGIVTVAGKPSQEQAEATYRSILKQAGLKK
jgi:predicted RNA binding protein YcfA (HicA-like mRNA interferase family)